MKFSFTKRHKPSPDEITHAKKLLEESERQKEESERQLGFTKEVSFALSQIRKDNHIVKDLRKALEGGN